MNPIPPGIEPLIERAKAVVLKTRNPSITNIGNAMRVNHGTAEALLSILEERGIVTAPDSQGIRNMMPDKPKLTPYLEARVAAEISVFRDHCQTVVGIFDFRKLPETSK